MFLTMVYGWLIEGGSKEQVEQIDAQLSKPPAGVKKDIIRQDPQWSEESMSQGFLAQLAARGGNARVSG